MSNYGAPAPKVVTTYLSIFNQTHQKRLRYVNRVIFLVAALASVLLRLPFKNSRWSVLMFLYQLLLLAIALLLVKFSRNANSVVEYLRAKTMADQVRTSVVSRLFLITSGYYLASAALFFGAYILQLPLLGQYYVLSKEFRKLPAVNDQWVYFWFHGAVCAAAYACQQLILQRNRLRFKYGVSSVKPRTVMFVNGPVIVGTSLLFTGIMAVACPLLYIWSRSVIYKLNWLTFTLLSLDSNMPPRHIGVSNLLSVSFASFVLFLTWEFINHVYETYATVGCLDGKRLISSQSTTPAETLLLGLRDVSEANQLARLTAFQELAFIASNDSPESLEARKSIYSIGTASRPIWLAFLDECSLVIDESNLRINFRTKEDLEALKNLDISTSDEMNDDKNKDSLIFGNSTQPKSPSASTQSIPDNGGKNEIKAETASKVKESNSKSSFASYFSAIKKHAWNFMYEKNKSPTKALPLTQVMKNISLRKQMILESQYGVFFRTTLQRDAESRVLNPVNCGNAIVSLSGILLHAVEEDRSDVVTDQHISEVFNLLERPIRSCTNYINVTPASVYLSESQRKSTTERSHLVIALLHDIAMREYVNLCIKYNFKLNDLLLTPKAFKLAKWVIDASIAQQLQQKQQQISSFI